MPELILTKFIIDVVQPVDSEEYEGAKVQLVSYVVLAGSAEEAMKRFFEDEAGVVMYEGDVVDRIMVGIQEGNQQVMDIGGQDARHLPV